MVYTGGGIQMKDRWNKRTAIDAAKKLSKAQESLKGIAG
jgi:hypothetical protein